MNEMSAAAVLETEIRSGRTLGYLNFIDIYREKATIWEATTIRPFKETISVFRHTSSDSLAHLLLHKLSIYLQ